VADLSALRSASLIGAVVFGYLWYRTSPASTYETVEMETVSTRRVFLILCLVCLGFFLASALWWR